MLRIVKLQSPEYQNHFLQKLPQEFDVKYKKTNSKSLILNTKKHWILFLLVYFMFIENEVNLTNTDKYLFPKFYSFLFLFLLLTPDGVADVSQPSLLAPALLVGSSEALLVPKNQTSRVISIFIYKEPNLQRKFL